MVRAQVEEPKIANQMKDLEQSKSFFFGRLKFHNGVGNVCDLQGIQNLKKIIIIAGPNGAGKPTFARDFLPAEAQTLRFINADLIAAGLALFNPESASFKAGLENFHERYSKVVNSWALYDSYLVKITMVF